MNWINTLLNNPLILIFLVSFLGVVLGRVGTKNIKLGAAAALIVGIFFGHAGYAVPGVFFNLAITMFMATVGLLASRDAFRLGCVVMEPAFLFLLLLLRLPVP